MANLLLDRYLITDTVTGTSSIFAFQDGVLVRQSGIIDLSTRLRGEVYDVINFGQFPARIGISDLTIDLCTKNKYVVA